MAFPTTSVLDDFNRANADPVSGSWTLLAISSFELELVSNQVTATGAGVTSADYYDASTYGPDCEAFCTIATVGSSGQQARLWVRLSDGSATTDAYMGRVIVQAGANNDSWEIFRYDNGVSTQLGATVAGPDIANGDKLGLEGVGSTLQVYRYDGSSWTSIISRTDATYSGAGYLGLTINNTVFRVDDFGGGTVDGGTPPAVVVRHLGLTGVGT